MPDSNSPDEHTPEAGPSESTSSARRITLTLVATLIVCGFVVFQAVQIRGLERVALERDTELALERVRGRIESLIAREIAAIARMARRAERTGIERLDLWEADALHHVNDFAHIQAMEWVDRDLIVRRVVPLEGNEAAVNFDLSLEPRRLAALEVARGEGRVTVSRTVSLAQGGTGFWMVAPVYDGERSAGFVSYAHRMEPLFDAVIGHLGSQYTVRLQDGGETVYDSCSEGEASSTAATSARSGSVSAGDLELDVTVTPTKARVDFFVTRLPEILGIIGSALALAVGLLSYLQGSARRRMRVLARTSRALEEQVVMRRHAEESERASHAELARIMESVSDCLWSARIAPNGTVEYDYVSPVIEQITGYLVDFFPVADNWHGVDDPWFRAIVPEDRQKLADIYEKMNLGLCDRAVCEYRITRSDGEIVWLRDSFAATRHPWGSIQFDGILTDISASVQAEEERRRLEERIQQTQKLESIGILAGGIAHDFNNLLVSILGNADLAANSADCPSHVRESLQHIETAAQRASELCRELLAYSGRASYVIEPIDLADLVREMNKLLRLTIASGIRIENDFPEKIALIEGDATQLRQLVMNLISNAADSMTDRPGEIQISLEERRCEEAEFAHTFAHDALPAGQYVVLSVSDTGCGMTKETLSRIFDPFFTTKFTGRGLGLAAALGIVRGHHGAISVTSDLGVGTRSLVYLPALAKKQDEPATGTAEAAWHASGVVLYVDDEDPVRRVGTRMLERIGMKVIPVASGEEALTIIDSDAHELRGVILDLMMPGLSGADTLRAIREKDRDLPVLILTGYGEADANDLLGGLSATGLLAKPFTSQQLEQALRAALV